MAKPSPLDRAAHERARELRNAQTRHERALWARLRCRQLGGLRFRRQHPLSPYIVDFFCPEHRLIVELDGSQHSEDEQQSRDVLRTRTLEDQGYRVLRFSNWEVDADLDGVLRTIAAACGIELDAPLSGTG